MEHVISTPRTYDWLVAEIIDSTICVSRCWGTASPWRFGSKQALSVTDDWPRRRSQRPSRASRSIGLNYGADQRSPYVVYFHSACIRPQASVRIRSFRGTKPYSRTAMLRGCSDCCSEPIMKGLIAAQLRSCSMENRGPPTVS